VGSPTQTVDLLPTVFDLLEIGYPAEEIQGRSLVPLLAGETETVNAFIFARDEGEPASYLVRDLRSALILYQGGELRALYDLASDPRQTENVMGRQPERAAELMRAFRDFAQTQRLPPTHFLDAEAEPATMPSRPHVPVSPGVRRELEALGYLD
jgi:arylsulfatase A-like enzyme